ncbi:uncharacterized protein EAF01_007017 [Botrytis porri]|uniref:Uncharacterized protein n=1 Tax=Botrytis porri TaxID=87229 RepID=A0A4Z1KXK0_9HELO|nr:uncharacterized protein EAF01_007017 [Botrytis porri]KAF7901718.1 hypothetical protein EAF01_007017 [Botrytis porri]TGO89274.1 hypothetical protein BPOR_0117g00220 [Botrytis porri]
MFSISVIKDASLAALIGTIFRTMDFVGFAPAATLFVVPINIIIPVPIPVLNGTKFSLDIESYESSRFSSISQQIAKNSASLADVVSLGLTLKCREAKSTEQANFVQRATDREKSQSQFIVPQINDSIWNNSISGLGKYSQYLLFYFSPRPDDQISRAGELGLPVSLSTGTGRTFWIPYLIDNPLLRLFTACDDIQASLFKSLFPPSGDDFEKKLLIEPWQCRNRTSMRAIEDLSINIPIGCLGSPSLTSSSTKYANITTSDTKNVYVYHPLYLVLSYNIGFFLASLCGAIGLYSMHLNGISHSNSFSAIMLTTRNPDLDILARGKSLGSDPLSKSIKNTKLRFGPLISQHGPEKRGSDDSPRHVAFGPEGSVDELKKDGKYM